MDQLIELLTQIQDLAGVAIEAIQEATGGEGGAPPEEGGKPPAEGPPEGEPPMEEEPPA